jgi:hypothetical protein
MTENIAQIPTTTTITSSANPVAYGQSVTYTVTVKETATGNPATGYIQGTFGENTLSSSGQVIWSTDGTDLPVGADTVKASFYPSEPALGDQDSSATLVETITSATVTPAPTFSPPAGTYSSPQQVTLNDADGAANIYYTIDGTTPIVGTSNYLPAGSGISVTQSETIEALAQLQGDAASAVVTAVYVISVPTPDFAFSLNPASLTISSGGTGTSSITVGAIDGFSGSVSFACSGLPAAASCSFSPAAVTPGTPATLTITAAASASSNGSPAQFPFAPVTSLALVLGWIGLRRRRLQFVPLLVVALVLVLFSLTGCGSGGAYGGGGGQNPPPNQTTSTVTVTATSGSLPHTATLTLTVN